MRGETRLEQGTNDVLGFGPRRRTHRRRILGRSRSVGNPNAILFSGPASIPSGPVHHYIGIEKRHPVYLINRCIAPRPASKMNFLPPASTSVLGPNLSSRGGGAPVPSKRHAK